MLFGDIVIEIGACREDMRCCGIGAGFSVDSAYHPFKIRSAAIRNFREFRETGADAVCVYCAGCLITLLTNEKLYLHEVKAYHVIELIQMAMGEEPTLSMDDKRERAKQFFWGVIKKQVPKILSRKTFKLDEIPEEPPDYGDAW